MKKIPTCKSCGEQGHYAINCRQTLRKPIKTAPKTLKPKKAVVKKPKLKTRSYYVKKLDSVFSKYIRYSAVESDGLVWCVTCQSKLDPKTIQNGHYYSRGKYSTRWDEMNCHPQCVACNVFKKGNYTEYAIYIIDRYGIESVKELGSKSNTITKITTLEIKEMIELYSSKLNNLLERRK